MPNRIYLFLKLNTSLLAPPNEKSDFLKFALLTSATNCYLQLPLFYERDIYGRCY